MHQEQLSDILQNINKHIIDINKITQFTKNYPPTTVPQHFFHESVEKISYSCRKGKKVNIRKRLAYNSVYNGIHPTDIIVQKWHTAIHANLAKIVPQLSQGFHTWDFDCEKQSYI